MKLLILVLCVACAVTFTNCLPVDAPVETIQYLSTNDENGYQFNFETSDGQKRDEVGIIKNSGTDAEAMSVQGSYSFKGSDGVNYRVDYEADENGYRANVSRA